MACHGCCRREIGWDRAQYRELCCLRQQQRCDAKAEVWHSGPSLFGRTAKPKGLCNVTQSPSACNVAGSFLLLFLHRPGTQSWLSSVITLSLQCRQISLLIVSTGICCSPIVTLLPISCATIMVLEELSATNLARRLSRNLNSTTSLHATRQLCTNPLVPHLTAAHPTSWPAASSPPSRARAHAAPHGSDEC